MNPERWELVKRIYNSVLEQESGRRTDFLREACADDESLQSEVESMLANQAEAADFLESPALCAEARALAGEYQDNSNGRGQTDTPGTCNQSWIHVSLHSLKQLWWLYLLAAIFIADCVLRTYCSFLGPRGFEIATRWEQNHRVVAVVRPGSAADRAGLKPGDAILALDGQAFVQDSDWRAVSANYATGRLYVLTIERDGVRKDVSVRMERLSLGERRIPAIWQIDAFLLLSTGLLIAFARPRNLVAGIGALSLATLSSSLLNWASFQPGYLAAWRSLPIGVGELLWIPNACSYLVGPILLTFFTLFPRPLFRRRWLWLVIWLPALCFVPVYLYTNFYVVYRPMQAYGHVFSGGFYNAGVRLFGIYGLASLAALIANYFRLTDANDKRRLRVLLVGGGAAVVPGGIRLLIWRSVRLSGLWNWFVSDVPNIFLAAIFVLFPVCFAYSILRHRLLDIRVIIRQGLQYALARGALLSIVPILGVILISDLLMHGDQPLIAILEMRGWIYLGLGVAAIAAHSQRHRWGEAIDRRFFREHHDVRHVLRDVAAEAGRARNFSREAVSVVTRLEAVFHPEFVAILERKQGEPAFRSISSAPGDRSPQAIPEESTIVGMLRGSGDALEVLLGESERLQRQLPRCEIQTLRQDRIELIVPIGMTSGNNEALMVLGMKRSEESYTREDRDMLSAIAANLELLLVRPEILSARTPEQFEECPQCGTCYPTGTPSCGKENGKLVHVRMPRILAGRYQMERRLGRGGMGAVYEATDSALGRRVAVKVIREDRLNSPAAAQRFHREAHAAAAFAHPNVVTVYDYGVEAGTRAFLVMELLQGRTLRDELHCSKRLDADRTIRIFRGICSAVEAAHLRHLIHRDLKPENFFLSQRADGLSELVKVLDFGIAKFLPDSEDTEDMPPTGETDAGILVGTPGYMSPEQLLGETPAVSWDLWALAVTAYETLTGKLPFPVATRTQWRKAVLVGEHTCLREHLPEPPPDAWEEFFASSLASDRAMRPQSAAEFIRRFGQALA